MRTINGTAITARDYYARMEQNEKRMEEMQADVMFLSCLLIFMAGLTLWLALEKPIGGAVEKPAQIKSEMSKQEIASLQVIKPRKEWVKK